MNKEKKCKLILFGVIGSMLFLLVLALQSLYVAHKHPLIVIVPAYALTQSDWNRLCAPYLRNDWEDYVATLTDEGVSWKTINQIQDACSYKFNRLVREY